LSRPAEEVEDSNRTPAKVPAHLTRRSRKFDIRHTQIRDPVVSVAGLTAVASRASFVVQRRSFGHTTDFVEAGQYGSNMPKIHGEAFKLPCSVLIAVSAVECRNGSRAVLV
jgi:hypothetical protein